MPMASDVTIESIDGEFFWLRALRWCPQGLLDLVNSKACRGKISANLWDPYKNLTTMPGAIMFNDSLSIGQCEKLVKQLSETAFPFRCAHGR